MKCLGKSKPETFRAAATVIGLLGGSLAASFVFLGMVYFHDWLFRAGAIAIVATIWLVVPLVIASLLCSQEPT